MATQVNKAKTVVLGDGDETKEVVVRPLNIRRLRKFMAVVEKFQNVENQDEGLTLMVEACAIAISATDAALSEDVDTLEDLLDLPAIYEILEVAGGIKMDDPNQTRAALRGVS